MEQEIMKLEKGQVLRLPGEAGGCSISCSEGVIWLTRENDREDHILTPGSTFTLSGKGLSVIEAVRDCTVRISPALATGTDGLVKEVPA